MQVILPNMDSAGLRAWGRQNAGSGKSGLRVQNYTAERTNYQCIVDGAKRATFVLVDNESAFWLRNNVLLSTCRTVMLESTRLERSRSHESLEQKVQSSL